MSTDTPPLEASDATTAPPPQEEPLSALSRPDLKRTLRDLLVQDEVSDSDVEMLEKYSVDEPVPSGQDDAVDPDMCVECGDQVLPRTHYNGNRVESGVVV